MGCNFDLERALNVAARSRWFIGLPPLPGTAAALYRCVTHCKSARMQISFLKSERRCPQVVLANDVILTTPLRVARMRVQREASPLFHLQVALLAMSLFSS